MNTLKIHFDYEQGPSGHILKTKTTDGASIDVHFEGLDASHFYFNDVEFDLSTDSHKGMFVDFGSPLVPMIYPISRVIEKANTDIDGIVSEGQAESRSYERHVQSFSSPA